MTQAGEKAFIRYLGIFCTIGVALLSTTKYNNESCLEILKAVTDIYDKYIDSID